MNKEKIKQIEGYEDYFITTCGRVLSKKRGPLRELKFSLGSKKYPKVGLFKNNKMKNLTVHSLVAKTFIPNPFSLKEINHKDGNKLNSSVENLEWVTREQNEQHAWQNGLKTAIKGENHYAAKLKEKDVVWIFENHIKFGGTMSSVEIAKKFNVMRETIKDIAKGRNWKHIYSKYARAVRKE